MSVRIVPVGLICVLALAVAIKLAMGEKNQTLDGLVVQKGINYEFYPGAKDCRRQGTPYWLVPNREFHEIVHTDADVEHPNRLFRGTWRVKLRGDLSHVGRYGYREKYWHQLSVLYVIDAKILNCKDAPPAALTFSMASRPALLFVRVHSAVWSD